MGGAALVARGAVELAVGVAEGLAPVEVPGEGARPPGGAGGLGVGHGEVAPGFEAHALGGQVRLAGEALLPEERHEREAEGEGGERHRHAGEARELELVVVGAGDDVVVEQVVEGGVVGEVHQVAAAVERLREGLGAGSGAAGAELAAGVGGGAGGVPAPVGHAGVRAGLAAGDEVHSPPDRGRAEARRGVAAPHFDALEGAEGELGEVHHVGAVRVERHAVDEHLDLPQAGAANAHGREVAEPAEPLHVGARRALHERGDIGSLGEPLVGNEHRDRGARGLRVGAGSGLLRHLDHLRRHIVGGEAQGAEGGDHWAASGRKSRLQNARIAETNPRGR